MAWLGATLATCWLLLLARGSSGQSALKFMHPAAGGSVTVNRQIMLDLVFVNWTFAVDGDVCIDVGAELDCYSSPQQLAISIKSPGLYSMKAHLVSKPLPSPTGAHASARDRIVASTSITFTAEEESTCEHHFGQAPCGALRPHCALFPKFRFYLYPATSAPTAQAVALYISLRDHPMRTEKPEEACIFIGAGDVFAANTPGVNEFEGSRLYTRLQFWGNGDNHLVFHFGDYAAKYDTGHAILARSSFGPLLDRAWYNPANPEAVPQMVQQRAGYDVVVPLPFYRCGMGDHAHLQRFSVQRSRGQVRPPSARRLLATFRGAVNDFPESHPAHVRRLLPELHDVSGGVVIVPTCWSVAPGCLCPGNPTNAACPLLNTSTSRDPRCAEWHARGDSPEFAFDALLLDARFALVAPGEGTHSYRLYEALQAGAVPVLLGESAMPLPEVIEWEDIAVIARDTSRPGLRALLAHLRRMPDAVVDKMALRGFEVFSANLKDMESQLSSTFAALAIRFAAAVAKKRAALSSSSSSRQGEEGAPASGTAMAAMTPATTASMAEQQQQQGAALQAEPRPTDSPAGAGLAASLEADSASIDSDGIARVGHRRRHGGGAPLPSPRGSASVYSLPPMGNAGTSLVQLSAYMWERFLSDPRVQDPASRGQQLDAGEVRRVVALLLQWLSIEGRSSRLDRAGSAVHDDLLRAYVTLSQAYSVLGHWRHAATAAQLLGVFHPYDSSTAGEADNVVILRGRNAMYDARRRCRRESSYRRPRVELGQRTLQRLYRTSDALVDADDERLSGYGVLSGFLPPSPLGAVDSPSYAMPLLPASGEGGGAGPTSDATHPDAVMPFVGVDEAVLQAIAMRLGGGGDGDGASGGGLRGGGGSLLWDRLPDFRTALAASSSASAAPRLLHQDYLSDAPPRHAAATGGASSGVAPPPMLQQQLAGDVAAAAAALDGEDERSRIAIVSLCAYDPAATKLAELSIANLRAYCERHGYDCFVGTVVLDPRRPPAWSKLLMMAQFLPSYEWVMWRDCDSFFMAPEVRLEGVIAAAAAARGILAAAVGEEAQAASGCAEAIAAWSDDAARRPPSANASLHVPLPAGAACVPLASSSMDFIVSEDGLMINTGVFFLRNSPWAREFVARAYGLAASAPPPASLPPFYRTVAEFTSHEIPRWRLSEEALSVLSVPSVAAAAGKREVAALKAAPLPFQTNRAWEQGAVLYQLAATDSATLLQGKAVAASVADPDELDALLVATVDAGVTTLMLPSFDAALHMQAVPQAWLNSYPPEIAGRLHEHHGRAMHAAYAPGDWIVSFSGCGVLVGARQCEELYRHFAAAAAASDAELQG